jgi:hypothetical protein
LEYGANSAVLERPVAVHVGEDAASTQAGQATVLALVNMLVRVHRHVVLSVPDGPLLTSSLVPPSTLPTACVATAMAIDPFINLEPAPRHMSMPSVGIGSAAPTGLDFYLGADRFAATLATDPVALTGNQVTILGGGLAACLGAAALFRLGHGHRARPRRVTLWGFTEGDHAPNGPEELHQLDVGDVLQVGAGRSVQPSATGLPCSAWPASG